MREGREPEDAWAAIVNGLRGDHTEKALLEQRPERDGEEAT